MDKYQDGQQKQDVRKMESIVLSWAESEAKALRREEFHLLCKTSIP